MGSVKRKVLCVGAVALLLLGLVGSGVAVSPHAQKVNAANNGAQGLSLGRVAGGMSPMAAIKAPINVVHSGQGFALTDDDEFHVLRIHIVRVRNLQPTDIRGLLEANKSIEEIRAEIMEGEGVPFYRGYLRLGVNHYRLANISVSEPGDNRTLYADVMEPSWDSESTETIGSIAVTAMNYEGVRIGDGTLTMPEGNYTGDYRVLLTMHPIPPGLSSK